jgi:dihydroorotate dehydrogenase electron transfer subunit
MAEQFQTEITGVIEVAPGFFEIILAPHKALRNCVPGQFINVAVNSPQSFDPLLRRPFSLYRDFPGGVSFLFHIQGRGTRILAEKTAGEQLDIVAPLGQGFTLFPEMNKPLLIGGGVGCPPLYFLASKLLRGKFDIKACLGFANKDSVICREEFLTLGIDTDTVTDDGSFGKKALVTQRAEEIIKSGEVDAIYACGPKPMLKAVQALAGKYKLPCQLALEEMMACGVGVCLSCVVTTENGIYKRVCQEGPVFMAEEVLFT